jgi:hypothetical protein
MKDKNFIKITFSKEVSDLLKGAFFNLKEYSGKDISSVNNIIDKEFSIKIPLTIGVDKKINPKCTSRISTLILRNIGEYSRRKVPAFLFKNIDFEELMLWSFNISKSRAPILFFEVTTFQSSSRIFLNQKKEVKYFENSLSFPFIDKNKKHFQAIYLATSLLLSEFYFEDNPLLFSLSILKKNRYFKLFKNSEYIDELLYLCKFTKRETKVISKSISNKKIAFDYIQKTPHPRSKKCLFSVKIDEKLHFFRDFNVKFYESRGKITAVIDHLNSDELSSFKENRVIESKIFEMLSQYILYGKLVEEIARIFDIE